jgi:hypothetical protein
LSLDTLRACGYKVSPSQQTRCPLVSLQPPVWAAWLQRLMVARFLPPPEVSIAVSSLELGS